MRHKDEIKKSQAKLANLEKENLGWIIEELNNFLETDEISETELKKLHNCISGLVSLEQTYILRLIKLLKQNHMID
jgi:hypothetical protein